MRITLRVWRQAGPTSRAAGDVRRRERLARHVVPRDARRRQRGADREGRGSDRVRLGLPRGHLRHVRLPDRRPRARAGCAARRSASCTCARSRTATRSRSSRGARKAFPLVKDLVVDRSAFDRIIQAGGYTSINVGGAQDANAILIPKPTVEQAMDSAQCIGCGACVAACKNASAALFTSAKVSHLALLPQGQLERYARVVAHGRAARRRRLRQLLERRRVRSGLPEGDLDHEHRADEPRLRQGDAAARTHDGSAGGRSVRGAGAAARCGSDQQPVIVTGKLTSRGADLSALRPVIDIDRRRKRVGAVETHTGSPR